MTNASNQVRFGKAGRSTPTVPSVGLANVTATTKGTGKAGVPTAIALQSKRIRGLKLPANF